MDVTSHSITLISIIVGLGLTELLLNLHRLILARDRVRWDPLPVLWMAIVLLMLLNYWWAVVLRRDGSELAHTAAEYGLLLVHPLLLFLLCATVLPRLVSEDGIDMRRAYESDRRAFAWLFVLYMLANWILVLRRRRRLRFPFCACQPVALVTNLLCLEPRANPFEGS